MRNGSEIQQADGDYSGDARRFLHGRVFTAFLDLSYFMWQFAQQHAVTFAAGLAIGGYKPIVPYLPPLPATR
ncbi:hypothetical protein ACNKHT_02400 [Shigella flexneri]